MFNSKSSSDTTSQNQGFSEIGGPVSSLIVKGGGKKSSTIVNMLDGGAVTSSYQFAGDVVERSLRSIEVAGQSAAATADAAMRAVAENARGEAENVFLQGGKWLVIAVVAVAGFMVLGKIRG